MFTVKLSNGNELTGLTLNGNNFIAPGVIDDSAFEDGLDAVEIVDGAADETTHMYDAKLIQNIVRDGHSWFILAEKSEQDRLYERIAEIETALCEIDAGE